MPKALEQGSRRKTKALPVAQPGKVFTRAQAATVKRWYLLDDKSPSEIAEHFGITAKQVQQWLWRHGISQAKQEAEKSRDSARETALEAVQQEQAEYVESVRLQGQELTEKGFQLARKVVAKGDAIQFSAAVSGVERVVRLTRQAWGMDAKQQGPGNPQMITLNLVQCQPQQMQQAQVVDVQAPEIELDLA